MTPGLTSELRVIMPGTVVPIDAGKCFSHTRSAMWRRGISSQGKLDPVSQYSLTV